MATKIVWSEPEGFPSADRWKRTVYSQEPINLVELNAYSEEECRLSTLDKLERVHTSYIKRMAYKHTHSTIKNTVLSSSHLSMELSWRNLCSTEWWENHKKLFFITVSRLVVFDLATLGKYQSIYITLLEKKGAIWHQKLVFFSDIPACFPSFGRTWV